MVKQVNKFVLLYSCHNNITLKMTDMQAEASWSKHYE